MDVVFVHGAGGGAWEWAIWRRVFAAHGVVCRAIELEAAVGGVGATHLGDYMAQLREFVCRGDANERVLIGASLGGLLALAVADEVGAAALVLVNPIPPAPLAARLPPRAPYPEVIPWRRDATLASTRRAMPDADDAACAYAFRRWRDESGAVLNAARAGIEIAPPRARVLVVASRGDEDVPHEVSRELADTIGAESTTVAASHVGPLLGRCAAETAVATLRWLRHR